MSNLIYEYYSPMGLQKSARMSATSRYIVQEARRYGVDWRVIPGSRVVELSYKGAVSHYHHQIPLATTATGAFVAQNKRVTSNLLHDAGIRVPKGFRIRPSHEGDEQYLREVYDGLEKPLVVKPTSGDQGNNITVGIKTFSAFKKAVQLAQQYARTRYSAVVAEEMFEGNEYRILATRENVIGILNRIPARVIGDGEHTIAQLIKIENTHPLRTGVGAQQTHYKIRIDAALKENLAEQGMDIDTVLEKDRTAVLRRVSNVSQGGMAIDVTDKAHPSVAQIARKVMSALPGLALAGIDFMTTDITAQQTDESYVIIEVNHSPGFDIHDFPYKGKRRHAAYAFLCMQFPSLKETFPKPL